MPDSYLTPDEALAECKRRWGTHGDVFHVGNGWVLVGTWMPGLWGLYCWPFSSFSSCGCGLSFEEAFRDADVRCRLRREREISREITALEIREHLKG